MAVDGQGILARRLGLGAMLLAGAAVLVPNPAAAGLSGDVFINEIHYAPSATAAGALKYEYVELYARATTSLAGWLLQDLGTGNTPDLLYTFPSLSLPTGAFLVIVSSSASGDLVEDTDLSDGSGLLIASSLWTADLANVGDAVILRESTQLHDFVYYDEVNTGDPTVDDEAVAEGIWKDGAAIDVLSSGNTGRAIALRVDGESPNEANPTPDGEDTDWMQYSARDGGTPGYPNGGPVGVDGGALLSSGFRGIWPSPVVARPASFHFALATPGQVGFEVHDASGRLVSRVPATSFAAGPAKVDWRPVSGTGHALPAGVYLVQMTLDGRPAGARKLAVLR